MKFKKKSILYISVSLIVFLGLSVEQKQRPTIKPKPEGFTFPELNVQFSGLQGLTAGTADSWGFVRQSATWGRGNSTMIDNLLSGLQSSGLFERITSGEIIIPNQTSTTGVNFVYRVKIGENVAGISSTAYSGTKTFAHRFEAWKTGDSEPTLQMYFSSLTGTGTTGVLLYYNLSKLNPSLFGTATSAVVESYTFGNKGSMAQTYSWKNGPEDSTWISKNGRVIIREMNSGAEICVRTVVQLTRGSSGVGTLLDALCENLNGTTNTSNKLFYTLAYVQKTTSPFYTVAKSGLVKLENAPIRNVASFCGFNNSALPSNYGLFDQNGFVSDGAVTVPSGYPSTADVDSAFERTGATTGTYNSIVVSDYDKSDETFMDGLSSNATLAFKASTYPTCAQTFCINP